ncbi:MAG TPA: arylamine N-acetyltransferase [Pyrinomonadaceae bacterium]|nr:arylamine N-acetyltransferase [Pyrinomonadaceae bacterium]
MNIADYLSRIGYTGQPSPDLPTLKSLQRAHLLTVPFENLDIHWNQPIVLDTEKFSDKIVVRRRGGFCYELNGLFNELLRSIGFETRLVSARVFNGNIHGPEFDHAAIIARVGDDEYLVDVGFGAFTTEPLRFVVGEKQQDPSGIFVIRKFDGDYLDIAKQEDGRLKSEYIFKDIARELAEFAEMCDFQQYSPDSHFRKGKLCSIMVENGRKTLTEKSFIVTAGEEKEETPVTSDAEFYRLLESELGITAVSS